MFPLAMLAQIGLPILVKVVGGALGLIDNPLAKSAAKALSGVGDAISGKRITPAQIAEANRHVERMASIESAEFRTAIKQINSTIRAEIHSGDAYVRRWRPTFGYAIALTWTVQAVGLTYAIVATPEHAGEIIAAMTSLSVIWGVALSVLGVNVVKRSQDKALAAGAEPATGLGGVLARLIGGKPTG